MDNIIANLINILYQYTNNLGIAVFIFSLIINTIFIIPKYLSIKNEYVKNKYSKDTYLIKNEIDDPVVQLEKIKEIYKKEHYFYFLPILLNIVVFSINISIFFVIINYQNFFSINNVQSFLFVGNIVSKEWNLYIPVICGLINAITSNIYTTKENWKKQIIPTIIVSSSLIFCFAIYGRNFGQLYLIYMLGMFLIRILPNILFYRTQKEISLFKQEYSTWLLSQNSQNNKN